MSNKSQQIGCVVPAAGIGKRMQASIPKQYLSLGESTILDQTLSRLLLCHAIDKVIVAINKNDTFWPQSVYFNNPRITVVDGGVERSDSVLNGLLALETLLGDEAWVLVHDAARPCVSLDDIERLIHFSHSSQQGAILASPVTDTIKKSTDIGVETIDRKLIWRALTPQIFKLGRLKKAIEHANTQQLVVTDEAHAMELIGESTELVEGRSDNIKVTSPDDLALARFYLKQQEGALCE